MAIDSHAKSMLTHETRALLARLALVKPFSLQESMLPAAALLPAAQVAIDRFLITDRRELRRLLQSYLRWLQQPDNAATRRRGAAPLHHPAPQVQHRADSVRHVR